MGRSDSSILPAFCLRWMDSWRRGWWKEHQDGLGTGGCKAGATRTSFLFGLNNSTCALEGRVIWVSCSVGQLVQMFPMHYTRD